MLRERELKIQEHRSLKGPEQQGGQGDAGWRCTDWTWIAKIMATVYWTLCQTQG